MDYNQVARRAIDPIHRVGRVSKIYGIGGEVIIKLYSGVEASELINRVAKEPLWIEIDSIATPFFVRSAKRQGLGAMVAIFDYFDSEQRSQLVVGREVYMYGYQRQRERASDWENLQGYAFMDSRSGVSGRIVEVIDNTLNPLILVDISNSDEVYVPLAENLVVSIDKDSQTLIMELADGFFDL